LTRVDRDGNVRLFDKDNKQIKTFKMNQKLDMSEWLKAIKKDKEFAANTTQALTSIFGNRMGGVRATLEEARKAGGEIISQPDGTVLVRMGQSNRGGLDLRNNDRVFTESIIDTVRNTVNAAAVYDRQSSNMLGRMAYTYRNSGGNPELTHVYMESFNPNSPQNRQQRLISVTELSNVSFRINP
jgi:hypothetical protein